MNQREILLVPFPFSDQSGVKVRPVIVVSKDEFNNSGDDIIVCAITSNITKDKFGVIIEQKDLESGILYEKSIIKVENILKIKKMLIIKKIGKIKNEKFRETLQKIKDLFE